MGLLNLSAELKIVPLKDLFEVGVVQEVNAVGLSCPMPLLKAKQALHSLAAGEKLRVLASDGGSVRDFHAFAKLSGHSIVAFCEQQGEYYYVIQKTNLQ